MFVERVAQKPERGRAALIAGFIIVLQSDCESVQADNGYFSLADIFVWRATQDS